MTDEPGTEEPLADDDDEEVDYDEADDEDDLDDDEVDESDELPDDVDPDEIPEHPDPKIHDEYNVPEGD